MTCPLCNDTGFTGPIDQLFKDKEFLEMLSLAQVKNELSSDHDHQVTMSTIHRFKDKYPECGIERCFCSYAGDGLSHP